MRLEQYSDPLETLKLKMQMLSVERKSPCGRGSKPGGRLSTAIQKRKFTVHVPPTASVLCARLISQILVLSSMFKREKKKV